MYGGLWVDQKINLQDKIQISGKAHLYISTRGRVAHAPPPLSSHIWYTFSRNWYLLGVLQKLTGCITRGFQKITNLP